MTLRYGSARYEIVVENPDGVNRGVSFAEMDGMEIAERPLCKRRSSTTAPSTAFASGWESSLRPSGEWHLGQGGLGLPNSTKKGGQLDEALGAANLAVATAPDMPETNDALGHALQAMNAVSQSRGERRVIS